MKIFTVTFSTLKEINGCSAFEDYPITVEASDLEDAQEKAIDLVEENGYSHGSITSIRPTVKL